VTNRELGTIERIGDGGRLRLKMDGGRAVELAPNKHLHLDHGYAVTSHSSRGQTADRVLIHLDTELDAKNLLNRMPYPWWWFKSPSRHKKDQSVANHDFLQSFSAVPKSVNYLLRKRNIL
jgi:hypothetical protein